MKLAAIATTVLCLTPLAARAAEAPIKGAEMLAMEAGTWDADITFPSREAGKPDENALACRS
jgi:hypothetical protein